MDFPGRLIAGLLAVILLIIFPLQYIAGLNSDRIDALVDDRTHRFSDSIREKGFLDKHMYEEYMDFLDGTGEIYEVEIQDIKPVKGEGIDSLGARSNKELKGMRLMAGSGNKAMAMSTKEIQSFAAHSHTADCYAGNLHICNGTDCAYEGNISTEILLHIDMSGSNDYRRGYLVFSNNNGATWQLKNIYNYNGLNTPYIDEKFYTDQRITYGPDGYYYLSSYTWNFVDYYTNIVKYDPYTDTIIDLDPGHNFSGTNFKEVMYRNDKFFLTSPSASGLYYSSDAKTSNFKFASFGVSNVTINNIAYGNNIYVATGYVFGADTISVFTSANGINWTRNTIYSYGDNEANVIFTGDRFVLGTGGGYLYYSTNGSNWTYMGKPYAGGYSCSDARKIAYGNNRLVIADDSKIYVTSNYGQSYTYQMTDRSVYSINFADDSFYMGLYQSYGLNNGFGKSSNGTTWTYSTLPVPSNSLSWYTCFVYGITFNSIGDTGKINRGPCIKIGKYYDNNGKEVQPVCNTVVTSITATNPNQTVDKGKPIITTATATYLDGHTGTVNCTSNYNPNVVGAQTVTLTYTGLVGNAKTTGTRTCTISVTVKETNVPSSLSVTASAATVYNGVKPTFTVVVTYTNGTTKTLSSSQYTESGWSSGPGTKTVTFSYTENGKTVIKSVTITVKPNVISLTVTPSSTSVYNGTEPTYTVRANYENNTSVTLSSTQYTKTAWTLGVGTRDITFTYTENNKTVTATVRITVNPWLNRIEITPASQNIPRYTEPAIKVTVYFANGTSRVLSNSEYTLTGLDIKKIATQTITATYTLNKETKTATASVRVTPMIKECPRCKQVYELSPDDIDLGCPFCRELVVGLEVNPLNVEVTQGEALPITVTGIYNDGSRKNVTGWTSNYNPARIGLQIVTVQYRGHAVDITIWVKEKLKKCPICNSEYPASEVKCPFCAEKVVRIEANPKNITVIQYEPIPLSVTAYYADGSSKAVDDWMINRTSVMPGKYTATVSYKGATDTITLTVLSISSIECPICGAIYNISENPRGCPICAEEIIGIEAYLLSDSNLVQFGAIPAIAVILIFRDEHREFAFDNFTIENYDPHRLGVQTLRVLYKGFSTTVEIEVVNRLDGIMCPNGHEYYKNSDGTDPGCPFCHEDNEFSTIAYFDITYTAEILDFVYSEGIYQFQKGNYMSVIVTKMDKSLMYRLQKTFFVTSMLGRKKRFIYGGEVISIE